MKFNGLELIWWRWQMCRAQGIVRLTVHQMLVVSVLFTGRQINHFVILFKIFEYIMLNYMFKAKYFSYNVPFLTDFLFSIAHLTDIAFWRHQKLEKPKVFIWCLDLEHVHIMMVNKFPFHKNFDKVIFVFITIIKRFTRLNLNIYHEGIRLRNVLILFLDG